MAFAHGPIIAASGSLCRETASRALVHFEKAVQLTPDDAAAHAELAAILAERGDTQRAIAEYRVALYINPGDAAVRRALEKLQSHAERSGAPPAANKRPPSGK